MLKLRKKRVIKKKDRLSNKIIIFIIIAMAIIIIVSLIVISTRSKSDELSIPNERPDIIGEVGEIDGENIVVQTMVRGNNSMSYGNSKNITINSDTKIFFMSRRDDTAEKASRSDIKIGSRISVWVEQEHDDTWHASDIGIMKMMRQRK